MPPRYPPYEFSFMLLAIFLGAVWLTTIPAPATVVAVMPAWVVTGLAVVLLATGLLCILGCVWRGNPERGLQLESGALGGQTGGLLILGGSIYYTWAVGIVPAPPALGVGLLVAWMASNMWRLVEIALLISRARKLTQGARQ